jgi:hypothetical protein
MPNYETSKIYKIEPMYEHDVGDIYIGATTRPYLSQRLQQHRAEYKKWMNGNATFVRSYKLFEKYGIENCHIVLLEIVNAHSRDELLARENFHIQSVACVNKCIAGRQDVSAKENIRTCDDYKQMHNKSQNNWIEKNKDKYNLYQAKWRENHREYFKNYRTKNPEKFRHGLEKHRNFQNECKRLRNILLV